MDTNLVFLSIPALREQDLSSMPNLTRVMTQRTTLVPSFPCVTWPVQANMLTGKVASEHGVVANGFYWRESQQVEMWTAWNERILEPQVWDLLHGLAEPVTSAVWFPMLAKGCGGRFHLHAGPCAQSGRLRVAVVLHASNAVLRGTARRARSLSTTAFLGPLGPCQIDCVDSRVGRAGRP